MTEQQREYIITEEQLEYIDDLGGIPSKLLAKIHSRPYTNEREKVLDEVWEKCNEIERYEHTDSDDRDYLGGERIIPIAGRSESLYSVLQSLRKQGDQK